MRETRTPVSQAQPAAWEWLDSRSLVVLKHHQAFEKRRLVTSESYSAARLCAEHGVQCACISHAPAVHFQTHAEASLRAAHLGKAKVSKLDEANAVNEDILRFEISVHNVIVMKVLQRQHDAADVELRQLFVHAFQHFHLQSALPFCALQPNR